MKSFFAGAILGLAALFVCFSAPPPWENIPFAPFSYILDKAKAVSLDKGRHDPCPDRLPFSRPW